jgi:hypothetical protein
MLMFRGALGEGWRHNAWMGLLSAHLLVACGEVQRDAPVAAVSVGGTAGTSGVGGRSGAAGEGGGEKGGEAGGTGVVAPPSGDAGTGGVAGSAPQLAVGDCVPAPFSATGDENCDVVFAAGLRCGGPLLGVQVAEAALLASFRGPPGSDVVNQPFEFRPASGLVSGAVVDAPSRPALAYDGDGPILVAETDAGLHALPSGVIVPNGGQPLAARSEDGNLFVLAKVRGDDKAKALWAIDSAGEVEQRFVYPDAEQLQFVAGLPATSLVVADSAIDALEAPLWKADAATPLLMTGQSTFGAVALGGQAAMATQPSDGVVSVVTPMGEVLHRGTHTPGCPGGFVAPYPEVCSTRHSDLNPTTTTGYVLAATVAYAKGSPWLITLNGDMVEQCRLVNAGSCFETLPCDCAYRAGRTPANLALQLTRIDQPATSYRIQLVGVGNASYTSFTASSAGSVADLAIALTPAGAASIGYLLVRLK